MGRPDGCSGRYLMKRGAASIKTGMAASMSAFLLQAWSTHATAPRLTTAFSFGRLPMRAIAMATKRSPAAGACLLVGG